MYIIYKVYRIITTYNISKIYDSIDFSKKHKILNGNGQINSSGERLRRILVDTSKAL